MNSPLLNLIPKTLALDTSEAGEAGQECGETHRGKVSCP